MKLLLLCAALCAAPALAQTDAPTDMLPPAPKSAATVDALVWKFVPEIGSHWQLRTFTRIKIQQDIPAEKSVPAIKTDVTTIQSMTADYDVLSRDQFGASTIRVTYRDFKSDTTMKLNGKAGPAPAENTERTAKALNGATYTIKQAPNGVVWGVVGLKQFQRRMLEANGISNPALQEQFLKVTDSLSSEKTLKSLSQISGKLPGYPIRVGESWTYTGSLPATMPLQLAITGKRTLKELTADTATIAESASYNDGLVTISLPSAPESGTKIVVKMSGISGVISGTTRLARQSGVPLETTFNQTLDGVLSAQVSDKTGKVIKTTRVPQRSQITTRVVMEPR